MSRIRVFTLAAAMLLISVHAVVLKAFYATASASVWGNPIELVGAPLLASIAAWWAARDSGTFSRRVWRLVALSFLLATVCGIFYIYSFDYLKKISGQRWPSDFLVFFWPIPAVMSIFLTPSDPKREFRWLRLCDFVQVSVLVLSVELSQLYVPSRWETSNHVMQVRMLFAGIVFFGLLATSFLVRGFSAKDPASRRLFLRLAIFFFAFAITNNVTFYEYAQGVAVDGTWLDLLWTISYCGMVVIAATWREPGFGPEKHIDPPSPRALMLAQSFPLVIPAVVFPLALQISREQFKWAIVLVTLSFAAAGVRLLVVQNQLLASNHELKKNHSLLHSITESTSDAVFVKDLDGRYLMINPAGARFLGLDMDDVVGKTDEEVFVPEVGRAIMKRDRKVIAEDAIQTYEEFGTAAGQTRLYLSTKGPLRDPDGQVIGLLGVSRDITSQKRTEEEIRQSQQKLRIHIEHTPLAVVEWDLDFRVSAWNPSAERIFGYSPEEAIGQHAGFIIVPKFRELISQVWRDLLAQTGGTRSTNDNLTKSGRIISCEWYNTALIDDSGRVLGVASLVQEVTEQVALEGQLRQSQKMEAIGRLAGGVAHDFNNLLTVILGYAQTLADRLPAGSKLADSTVQIKSAAERAAGITRQLLAFSRKQVLSPQIIDLNDILLNIDSLLRRLIGEDVEVLTVPAANLGSVKADPGQIEQVIMNLALNARDAMPHGGKLTLETANVELDGTYSKEHVPIEPGSYVMFVVSDNGVGMPPEVQARIFEPFFTTKEVGKGTGLGLSTVYGIIKQSGGFIWVYSEPGQGTSFKIYFPRVEEPAQALTANKPADGIQRGTETILLVEDDNQLRQLSASVLELYGYKVLIANGPAEGLAICRANHREIRLLITDVVMPGMNGRQLAEQIQKISPETRVLYISGYTNNAIVHYGVLDEGLSFLQKPFTLTALVNKVRSVLDAEPDASRVS
jgi:two-component system, cell cycle sensor histidine kinase and response regulator CckA